MVMCRPSSLGPVIQETAESEESGGLFVGFWVVEDTLRPKLFVQYEVMNRVLKHYQCWLIETHWRDD